MEKRCRGVANAKTTEKLLLCWMGKLPFEDAE